jgi:hypothetical protein
MVFIQDIFAYNFGKIVGSKYTSDWLNWLDGLALLCPT